jgi:hypothetical protein
MHRFELEVIFESTACDLEKLVQAFRRCNNRRPGIESEALVAVDVGAPPRKRSFFENRDVESLAL